MAIGIAALLARLGIQAAGRTGMLGGRLAASGVVGTGRGVAVGGYRAIGGARGLAITGAIGGGTALAGGMFEGATGFNLPGPSFAGAFGGGGGGTGLQVGAQLPHKDTIVKTWSTGTANFARLADGRGVAQRKDGSLRTFRYPKHIVVSRNPRMRSLTRAAKKLDKLTQRVVAAPRQTKRAADRMKGKKK